MDLILKIKNQGQEVEQLYTSLLDCRLGKKDTSFLAIELTSAVESQILKLDCNRDLLCILIALLWLKKKTETNGSTKWRSDDDLMIGHKKKIQRFESSEPRYTDFNESQEKWDNSKMREDAKMDSIEPPQQFSLTMSLLEVFPPELLKISQGSIVELCSWFADTSCNLGKHMSASVLPVLKKHMDYLVQLQGGTNVLSTLHARYLRCCIVSNQYQLAYETVSNRMTDVSSQFCKPKDVKCYFYYAGKVYTALEKWTEAIHYYKLSLCLPCAPRFSLNEISISAYQQLVMVSLIHLGTPPQIPKNVPAAAVLGSIEGNNDDTVLSSYGTKHVVESIERYNHLARVFCTDYSSLKECVTSMKPSFDLDGTSELANHLLCAFKFHKVYHIQRTYSSISIDDFVQKIDFGGSETSGEDQDKRILAIDLTREMKKLGNLNAVRIDTASSMIHFLSDGFPRNSLIKLEDHQRTLRSLLNILGEMETEISESPAYLEFCKVRKELLATNCDKTLSNESDEKS